MKYSGLVYITTILHIRFQKRRFRKDSVKGCLSEDGKYP